MYSFRIPGFRRPSLQTNQTTPGPAQPFRCLLWLGRREGGKKEKGKEGDEDGKGGRRRRRRNRRTAGGTFF